MEGRFGTVLVDGFIEATWKIVRDDWTATLRVEPVAPLKRGDMDAVAEEGKRLLTFTDPDASHTVNVAQATKYAAGSRSTRSRTTGKSGATLQSARKKGA